MNEFENIRKLKNIDNNNFINQKIRQQPQIQPQFYSKSMNINTQDDYDYPFEHPTTPYFMNPNSMPYPLVKDNNMFNYNNFPISGIPKDNGLGNIGNLGEERETLHKNKFNNIPTKKVFYIFFN